MMECPTMSHEEEKQVTETGSCSDVIEVNAGAFLNGSEVM